MKEVFIEYYAKVVNLIKQIVSDDRLSDEEKVRLLGVIL